MSSDCTDVAGDIEQRIVQLASRIYSHQNLIAQYTQEKDRLQCILDNLNGVDNGGGTDGGTGDGGGTSDAPVVYYSSNTSLTNDGPWQ